MKSVAQPDKIQNTLGTSIRLLYRWSNCYTGESKTHVLTIGVGTMHTFVCQCVEAHEYGLGIQYGV